ncbi:MAG: leucine-rich repeat domain-containing protein [Planctomycetaceae bacterium]
MVDRLMSMLLRCASVLVASVSLLVLAGCGRDRGDGTGNVDSPQVTQQPQSSASSSSTAPKAGTGAAEVSFEKQDVTEEVLQSWLRNASLRRLRVAGSSIDDADLARLAESSRLELLDVTGSESIGAAGIQASGRMSSLRNLRVSGAAVTDDTVKALANLTNLAALSLQQTAVTDKGIEVISAMPKLKELNLYGTPVTDASLATISRLPSLQKLRLRATKVTGDNAAAFGEMNSVVDLDLSETSFSSGGLSAVAKMPKLRLLNLWLTEVDDAGVEALAPQVHLTQLNLDNVRGVTNQSLDTIQNMADLELLHLGGTSVTSEGLPKLYGLKKLKTLFVTRLNLKPEDVEALRAAMPWIERLES